MKVVFGCLLVVVLAAVMTSVSGESVRVDDRVRVTLPGNTTDVGQVRPLPSFPFLFSYPHPKHRCSRFTETM